MSNERNPAPYALTGPGMACGPMRWAAYVMVGDQRVVKDGFPTEAAAQAWINEWSRP